MLSATEVAMYASRSAMSAWYTGGSSSRTLQNDGETGVVR